jgi:NADP-dependent 3-hydroxy acid dehydrogenase YdfG
MNAGSWSVGQSMGDPPLAVVTGAASGLGKALASRLDKRGARLALVDTDRAGLSTVASRVSADFAVHGDVADPSTMEDLAASVGAINLLCLNAGVISTSTGAPWAAPPDEWARVLGVNLLGVVNGLRAFVPRMVERGSPANILITASLAGATTWPGGGPYAASKHAVLAVAEQTALELSETEIAVTVLCPDLVRTAISDQGADPRDIAIEALQAMEDGQFAVVPERWSGAVQSRASRLASGEQPGIPQPD